MAEYYTGLTIGPIYDTMQLTSSPAGLWGASYLFSWIAQRLLETFVQEGIEVEAIISPCISLDAEKNLL